MSGSPPAAVPLPAADGVAVTSAGQAPGRDRYLDLLRTLALARVVVYHLFGWAWLTVLFPSMGVMFALAGALTARSLKRPALPVIRGRLRRLLPPLWLFAAVVLPLFLVAGWHPGEEGAWGLARLLGYLVPVVAPGFPWELGGHGGLVEETWAAQSAEVLWYLRTYLWFVVASPLLLRLFRRAPWPTLAAPLALTAVFGTGLVRIPGETGETGAAITDFLVHGGCWLLGFAHHDGLLRRVPGRLLVPGAALVMAFGLWWASGHQGPDGWDLNDIPLAQSAWSFGFVAVLLRYAPAWRRLPGRIARLDRLVTLSNNRAVTIYLWHNLLIVLTVPAIDLAYELPFMGESAVAVLDATYGLWMLLLVWPMIAVVVLAAGWAEDLAARRPARWWPDGGRRERGRRGKRRRPGERGTE